MPSSRTNSIFHYSPRIEVLEGILANGFYPHYSLEDIKWLDFPVKQVAFPMVCFCDIPLSRVDNHVEFYGEYGIGLDQNWAVSSGLTPITYVSYKSEMRRTYRELADFFQKSSEKNGMFYRFLSYAKPMVGDMYRRGEKVRRHFYKECEWRYVPKIRKDHTDAFLRLPKFNDKKLLEERNTKLRKSYSLFFEASQVKYLIIKDDDEIPRLCNFIENLKKFSPDDRKILCTRILTLQSIKDNY